MTESTPEITCPQCGQQDLEPRGAVAVFYPRPVTERHESRQGRRIVERKYQCRGCSHEFSIIREHDS